MRELIERLEAMKEDRGKVIFDRLWQEYLDILDLYAVESGLDKPEKVKADIKRGRERILADIDALIRSDSASQPTRKLVADLVNLFRAVGKQHGIRQLATT